MMDKLKFKDVDKMLVSEQFLCKCDDKVGWITEGKETSPCPNCGRRYIGVYDEKKLTLVAVEINDK